MSEGLNIVVCGSLVPDPLQTLEPIQTPTGPGLKNEMMLPTVLDPWAGHALFEAAHLATKLPGSKVTLVSIGPKAKLQQLMMAIGQKASFQLVVQDGPAGGFVDSTETGNALAEAIRGIAGIDLANTLVFGGLSSASRDSGSTMQIVGELLGITEQFQAVDFLEVREDGSMKIKERVDGGEYLVSILSSAPAVLGWATGSLPEPPNNPQVGMANMRTIMPALQQAKPVNLPGEGLEYGEVAIPQTKRETRIEKDMSADDVAKEIVEWIKG